MLFRNNFTRAEGDGFLWPIQRRRDQADLRPPWRRLPPSGANFGDRWRRRCIGCQIFGTSTDEIGSGERGGVDTDFIGSGAKQPFRTLILSENAQEPVNFVALNNKAARYTIRIREAR